MPAWVWVVAAAAVLFVAWFAWGRGWWRSLRYSWRQAAHVLELTQTEVIPGAEYGSMIYDAELDWRVRTGFLPALDWREQTAADLSPEALAAEIAWQREQDLHTKIMGDLRNPPGWLPAPPDDPGPGDDLSSLASPGPDQRLCGPEQPHEKPAGTESAGSGHPALSMAPPGPGVEDGTGWAVNAGSPHAERLADTGEIRDAHLLAEVAAELRAQDDDARAYCSALERDRQTYMHQLREVFA